VLVSPGQKPKTHHESVFVTAELIEGSSVAGAEAKPSRKNAAKPNRQVDWIFWAGGSIRSVCADEHISRRLRDELYHRRARDSHSNAQWHVLSQMEHADMGRLADVAVACI